MDKLQELTDKLYQQGLAKGKQEGEAILEKAREEAAQIVNDARKEADAIVAKANADAQDYRSKVEGDVKRAAIQAIQATRGDIQDLIVAKIAAEPVKEKLSKADFLKEIISEVAKNFVATESKDIELVLPEKLRADLEPFVKGELAKVLGKVVEGRFSNKIAGGFTIGPKDGSYFISLSDESFGELIGSYLRPATRKILFGE